MIKNDLKQKNPKVDNTFVKQKQFKTRKIDTMQKKKKKKWSEIELRKKAVKGTSKQP